MATVVASQVGMDPTLPTPLSRRMTDHVAMIAVDLGRRFALWHRAEPAIDLWASAGALALAAVATALVFFS